MDGSCKGMPEMIWARKAIVLSEWDEIQDQFEELFMKLGGPRQMMLVATSSSGADQTDLCMSLPNSALLSLFQGFEAIAEMDLPSEASLLIGHDSQFKVRFEYPTRTSKI
jgi:hypothetical protein